MDISLRRAQRWSGPRFMLTRRFSPPEDKVGRMTLSNSQVILDIILHLVSSRPLSAAHTPTRAGDKDSWGPVVFLDRDPREKEATQDWAEDAHHPVRSSL